MRRLASERCTLLTVARDKLDLRNQACVQTWMDAHRPDVVVIAAATVGGILANSQRPADFAYDNMLIEANIIHASWRTRVDKLLFLGSSCVYPRQARQPMNEDQLLTGPLEPTNKAYAVAKIAGIELALAYRRQHDCDFVTAMPSNVYGECDRFDLRSNHVVPALLRKAHEAKIRRARELIVWGSGKPRREFLFVDDLADALVHILKHYSQDQHINVGTGEDLEIGELALLVADTVGFRGRIRYDRSKPDGAPRKLLDVSRLAALGWRAKTPLREGLARSYQWFIDYCAESVA
jgi:GDP-L-fucose synthase